VGDTLFQFKAGEFFQNNPHILPSLVDYVLAEARERSDVQYLLDAYCGVGLFALSARKSFDQILGIEISDQSVTWARKNAELNQAENCKFLLGSAEEIFNGVEFAAERTAVIIDPPRKGCDIPFLEQLVSYGPKKLVYVSCDPATQARDAQYLIEHGYILKKIQPFDLFPHTRHCESVATFDKA
jgi:23S rRNA (uracil1939-C5)-methyltransferase/tRNA (uracil-5-)-methyltransferase